MATDEDYVSTFCAFAENANLAADYLLVAGDISDSADPKQFELASVAVERIADCLGVQHNCVVATLGNHDVDWVPLNVAGIDTTGVRRLQAMLPASSSPGILSAVLEESGLTKTSWATWEFDDLVVVGHNSAWNDGPHAHPHHGDISQEQLDQIRGDLGSRSIAGKYRVFLVHHHPVQYSDPVPDFSIMANSEHLMELLAAERIDILIHGHKHVPRFEVHLAGSRHSLPVLCSGSFSKVLDNTLLGDAVNQFHLVEFSGRETDGLAKGAVRSWSFTTAKKWRPSVVQAAGIDHVNPFGRLANPDVLVDEIRPLLTEYAERGWTTWDELVLASGPLESVPAKARDDALGMIEREGIIEVLHDDPNKNDRIVLLIRGDNHE
jgi:predicted phosphodiesterase